jgi:chitodextrinase
VKSTLRSQVRRPRLFLAAVVLVAAAIGLLSLPSPADATAPDRERPSTPMGLTQKPLSATEIALTWEASTDNVRVTGYTVFRNDKEIATSPTPSYSDKGLAPSTTYQYRVSAYDAAGNDSARSEVLRSTTLPPAPGATTPAPPPDNTPPTDVSLTAPASGETVSGTVTVTATASDDRGVVGVLFLADGNPIGTEVKTAPYSVSWNTSAAPDGIHVLTARARDAADKSTTSAEVKVMVDRSAPTVAITPPTNVGEVKDIVNVGAAASDKGVGVASVEFLVDGAEYQEVKTPPFGLEFDSRTVTNGRHTLAARARDLAGNSTVSDPISLNVANDTSQCGVTGGNAPRARILEPTAGTVVAGEVITFRGEGTETGCGPIAASEFSWTVDATDGARSRKVTIPEVKNGSFTADVPPEFGVNTRYQITLEVTNREGVKAKSVVEIYLKKVQLTFNTDPGGLTLYFDGSAKTTPFNLDVLVGRAHQVEARNQTNGRSHVFQDWSDGSSQQLREIVVPSANQTYTARYMVSPKEPDPIVFKQHKCSSPRTNQTTVSTAYPKAQAAGGLNIIAISWKSAAGTIEPPTDTAGNKYSEAAQLTPGGGNLSQAIYFAKKIPAADAGNTVEVKFSGGRLGVNVCVAEYSGLDDPIVEGTSSRSGSNNSAISGPVTTTAANTLLFTAGTTWGEFGNARNEFDTRELTQRLDALVADRIVNAGTYEAEAPKGGSTSSTWLMQVVAFRNVS